MTSLTITNSSNYSQLVLNGIATTSYSQYSETETKTKADLSYDLGTSGYDTTKNGYGTLISSKNNTSSYTMTCTPPSSTENVPITFNVTSSLITVRFTQTLTSTNSGNSISITNISINNGTTIPNCSLTISGSVYTFDYTNSITTTVTYSTNTNTDAKYKFESNATDQLIYFETLLLGINGVYDYVVSSNDTAPIDQYAGFVDLGMSGLYSL